MTVLALQITQTTGWDYHLGTAGKNSVCSDPSAGCSKPFPSSQSQSHSQCPSLADSPMIPMRGDWSKDPQEMTYNAGGAGHPSQALFYYFRNQRLMRDLSAWCCACLGEGQCGQYVASSNAVCLGLCGEGGSLTSPSHFRNFSMLSHPSIVTSCSHEGEQS